MRRAPIEFRTTAILYTLLGIIIALVIHFVVLSSPRYNWLQLVGG
ncbi:light-harvesting protein [Kouleothrix sp.]